MSTFAEAFAHMQAGHEALSPDLTRWRIANSEFEFFIESEDAGWHVGSIDLESVEGYWTLIEPKREPLRIECECIAGEPESSSLLNWNRVSVADMRIKAGRIYRVTIEEIKTTGGVDAQASDSDTSPHPEAVVEGGTREGDWLAKVAFGTYFKVRAPELFTDWSSVSVGIRDEWATVAEAVRKELQRSLTLDEIAACADSTSNFRPQDWDQHIDGVVRFADELRARGGK